MKNGNDNTIDVLVKVKCPCCESDIEMNCSEWVVGSTSSEKSMGIDTQWIIESEPMNCPACNNEIVLEGTVGIYPEDSIEYIDVNFRKV